MPVITLLAGAALCGGVLVASVLATSSTPSASSSRPSPAAVGTVVALPSPGSPGTVVAQPSASVPANADYGGQAQGSDAAVAVSVHGNRAVAYVCDGHQVGQWFNGTAKAGTLDLTGSNGASLTVSYGDIGAAGYVSADGKRYAFSAPALHGHRYGLYESTADVHGAKIRAGWIELPYGTPVGMVESATDGAVPLVTPAPPLDLAAGTAHYDGVILVATLISGVTGSGF